MFRLFMPIRRQRDVIRLNATPHLALMATFRRNYGRVGQKGIPKMSEQAGSADPDKILAKGLEHFRKLAETEKGHTMDHWRFHENEPGHVIVNQCTQCGASVKIIVPEPAALTDFPSPAYVRASTALDYKCINPAKK
jgi:hypothetical protein